MFCAFIGAGLLMVILGLLNVGRLLRLLPASVMVSREAGYARALYLWDFSLLQSSRQVLAALPVLLTLHSYDAVRCKKTQ